MPFLTFGTLTKQQSGVFDTRFLPVCIPAARQVGARSPDGALVGHRLSQDTLTSQEKLLVCQFRHDHRLDIMCPT